MPDPTENANPSSSLLLLRERLGEVFARHGLELWETMVVPRDASHLAVRIIAGAKDEESSTDDEFEQVIASANRAEAELRAQRSVEDLTERLRRGEGFL